MHPTAVDEERDEVAIVHRAEDLGVHADHHEDERAGDTRQDHGADRQRTREEEDPPGLRDDLDRARGDLGVGPQTQQEEQTDRDDDHHHDLAGVDRSHEPPGDGQRTGDEAEEQTGHPDGLVVQELLDDRRQDGDGDEDADQEGDQPDPLDLPQRCGGAARTALHHFLECVGTGVDVVDQPLVDPQDERDGAA